MTQIKTQSPGRWKIYLTPPKLSEELLDRAYSSQEAQKMAKMYKKTFGAGWKVRIQSPAPSQDQPVPRKPK